MVLNGSGSYRFILLMVLFGALFVTNSLLAQLPTEDPPCGKLHPLLAKMIQAGPYKPQWESLVSHPVPKWFVNDKIGLSAHWGPYSVPGWTPRKDSPYGVAYAEWYWQWLESNAAVKEHHKKFYGDAKYDDFIDGAKNLVTGEIDKFDAKKFDADRWMRLFKQAGVKYFYITSKHHDGFCLWDTQYTDRNAVKMGPHQDLYGQLVAAARKYGIKVGFYYSFYEWNNPIYRNKDISSYKGCKPLCDQDKDGNSNEYVDDFMIPQIKELIDKYHPDYICFDGEWEHGYQYWRARQIVAYYYNQAAARGQEVVINDRFGQAKEGTSDTRGVYGDFSHVEYFANVDRNKPWSMWRGFGNSYGYNRNEAPENILSIQAVIQMIVNCVSDNGNVEFNIGPKADGTLAEFEVERLEAMGKWLSVNGAAIYDTKKSPIGIVPAGRLTHKPQNHKLYLLVSDWPGDGLLELPGILSPVTSAKLLATGLKLKVTRPEKDIVRIDVPPQAPDKYVSVIELTYSGTLKAEKNVPKIKAEDSGSFVLPADKATINGKTMRFEKNRKALGYWSNIEDYPQWIIKCQHGGQYQVTIETACVSAEAGSEYELQLDGKSCGKKFTVPDTGSWDDFRKEQLLKIKLTAGTHYLAVKGVSKKVGYLMNLREIRLEPEK